MGTKTKDFGHKLKVSGALNQRRASPAVSFAPPRPVSLARSECRRYVTSAYRGLFN